MQAARRHRIAGKFFSECIAWLHLWCLARRGRSLIIRRFDGSTAPIGRRLPGGSMKHLILVSAVGALAVCSTLPAHAQSAAARLEPTKGNATAGHGFHIHEKGDCSSGDGMSAGGHFNPTGKPHGNPIAPDHHTGDMPMLVADASGNASLSMELGAMTVGSGATDIVGKAVIVHKEPDDYTTQPTGNSGARVACGLIART